MGDKRLVPTKGQEPSTELGEGHSERELLTKVIRLQMILNSKLFEFVRTYQADQDWGKGNRFRDGSGSKTRIGCLFDEVNQIGVSLNEAASEIIGERLYEKRDEQGRVLAPCNECKKETPFVSVVNSPYGMAGAYMAGSERLLCTECRKETIYPGDERLPKFNSIFKTT